MEKKPHAPSARSARWMAQEGGIALARAEQWAVLRWQPSAACVRSEPKAKGSPEAEAPQRVSALPRCAGCGRRLSWPGQAGGGCLCRKKQG